ncbi:hypothetical protein HY389_01370 [Candidatus Daviesbacteria bacterium]|nr:hypothetical protein [Candidatus Daviesbacteria bacterium]
MSDPLYANARLRIRPDVVVHVTRGLGGGKGELHVAERQEVTPSDILGLGEQSGGFATVDLAKELGVSPGQVPRFLFKKLGQNIFKGELLAGKKGVLGLGQKVVLAPSDGVLDYLDPKTGELRLKFIAKRNKVVSGVYGIIDKVDLIKKEVLIRTRVTEVYGVLGTGRERSGFIHVLGAGDVLVSSKQIGPGLTGDILVGGGMVFADALMKAVSTRIPAVVSGGIEPGEFQAMTGGKLDTLTKRWSDVGVSLLVTEGFGAIPIGEDIFKLLGKYNGRFAIINGNLKKLILPSIDPDSMMYIRKVAVPLQNKVESIPDLQLVELKVGLNVRMIALPYRGWQGKIVAIDKTATTLPSGISTYLVTIDCPKGKIRAPYLNIEVVI